MNGANRQHSGHQAGLAGAAQVDPEPTFMAAPPGEPLHRKADDKIQCDSGLAICA
jgi:hypothetical protein